MAYKRLYIIGNGFDLHHNIKSKYTDFKNWLKENDDKYNANYIINNYFPVTTDFWNDFEANLVFFKINKFSENAAIENRPSLNNTDHFERELEMSAYLSEQDFEHLVDEIRHAFHDWVYSLNKPNIKKKIFLDKKDAFFINFNYTKSLESLYGIPEDIICHIHGCIDIDENFIFGHGDYAVANDVNDNLPDWCDSPILMEQFYKNNYDVVTDRISEQIESAVNESLRKDVDGNIAKHHYIFSELSKLETIYIYGWSFSNVDIPYLEEILRYNDVQMLSWEISYYSDEDLNKIRVWLKRHNVRQEKYKLIKLDKIVIPDNQLSLF